MNILFVCTANKERSRTAEIHFQYNYKDHRFRSAGINQFLSERHGGTQLKKYMLDLADIIICMENAHKDWINKHHNDSYKNKMFSLDLGDTDTFMTRQLISALEMKIKQVIPPDLWQIRK